MNVDEFIIIIAAFGVFVGLQGYILSEQEIDFETQPLYWCGENASLYKSIGQSMKPYSNTEGYYWAEPVKPEDVKVGDVITFEKPGSDGRVHHAVINAYTDFVLTAGYNNEAPDNYKVPRENIVLRDCVKKE